jgi:enoyl-CoA hydratase/carnithine racemase
VLNRPPVNAVNQRMYRELHALFSQADRFLPDASVAVAASLRPCQPTGSVRALEIARHSPAVLRVGKKALNEVKEMPLHAGYELEQGRTLELSDLPDGKEAIARFFAEGS